MECGALQKANEKQPPYRFLTKFWYRYLRKDLKKHPHFRMEGNLKSAVDQYRKDSRMLEIF